MGQGPLDAPSVLTGMFLGLLAYGVGSAAGLPRSVLIVGCLLGWIVVALILSRRPWIWVALGTRRLLPVPLIGSCIGVASVMIAIDSGFVAETWRTTLRKYVILLVLGLGIYATGMAAYGHTNRRIWPIVDLLGCLFLGRGQPVGCCYEGASTDVRSLRLRTSVP